VPVGRCGCGSSGGVCCRGSWGGFVAVAAARLDSCCWTACKLCILKVLFLLLLLLLLLLLVLASFGLLLLPAHCSSWSSLPATPPTCPTLGIIISIPIGISRGITCCRC
jgi:hypothetical protein